MRGRRSMSVRPREVTAEEREGREEEETSSIEGEEEEAPSLRFCVGTRSCLEEKEVFVKEATEGAFLPTFLFRFVKSFPAVDVREEKKFFLGGIERREDEEGEGKGKIREAETWRRQKYELLAYNRLSDGLFIPCAVVRIEGAQLLLRCGCVGVWMHPYTQGTNIACICIGTALHCYDPCLVAVAGIKSVLVPLTNLLWDSPLSLDASSCLVHAHSLLLFSNHFFLFSSPLPSHSLCMHTRQQFMHNDMAHPPPISILSSCSSSSEYCHNHNFLFSHRLFSSLLLLHTLLFFFLSFPSFSLLFPFTSTSVSYIDFLPPLSFYRSYPSCHAFFNPLAFFFFLFFYLFLFFLSLLLNPILLLILLLLLLLLLFLR